MLTVLEVCKVIEDLDAPGDVITSACQRVLLGPCSTTEGTNWADAVNIAQWIGMNVLSHASVEDFIVALAISLGAILGQSTKLGSEKSCLKAAFDIVIEAFHKTEMKRLMQEADKDPEKFLTIMLEMIRNP